MWVFGDGEYNVLMIKERGFIYTRCLQYSKDWPGIEEGCLPWHCWEVSREVVVELVRGFDGRHGIVEAQGAQLGPRLVPEITASTKIWNQIFRRKT